MRSAAAQAVNPYGRGDGNSSLRRCRSRIQFELLGKCEPMRWRRWRRAGMGVLGWATADQTASAAWVSVLHRMRA